MADTTPSRKGGSKTGWSDAEKIALLVSILDSKGGNNWKEIKLPEGRTEKACMHVVAKMREIAKAAGVISGNDDGKGQGAGNTAGVSTGKTKKRTGGQAYDVGEQSQWHEDDEEETKPKSKLKRGAKKVKTEIKEEIKEEEYGEDDV